MNLSWLALFLSIAATLPHLYSTLRSGLVRDQPTSALAIAFVANAVLAVHGYIRKDVGIVLLGLWFTLYNAVLTYYKVGGNQETSNED